MKAPGVWAIVAVMALAGASHVSRAAAGWTCNGPYVKIFDNTHGNTSIANGAIGPTFTTKGPYCVFSIGTTHWNGGKGSALGTVGLKHVSGPAGFATVG